MTSMSATWKVPRLAASTVGSAATSIGAQSGGSAGPFIQIGIADERLIPSEDASLHLPAAAYEAALYAFWSDTDHHFLLRPLAPVSAGDVVDASLTLTRGRWRVRLVDAQSFLKVNFSTRDEGRPLGTAEWLQEDVTNAKTGRLRHYPSLSTVRFSDLRVDGTAPSDLSLTAESMSPRPLLTILPSPVGGDAFTVPHAP
ncbi:MAG TPA: hypothetical protein VHX66_16455 [Solirubrobacteraceae bacterium]|nr:hypothetical protein [Solirubrobacteraceae bacterium]